jgi:hypothetical protein
MLRSSLLTLAAICGICGPAVAGGEAFVSHGDGMAGAWGRDIAIREALETDLGFETVRMNADSTPKVLASLVTTFLEQPGEPGDRRFVWISGPVIGVDSPCPSQDAKMIKPATAALILVPDCYAEFISLPPAALHVSLRNIPATPPNSLVETTASTLSVAIITLPSDNVAAIAAANRIVLSAIKLASEDGISAAHILQRLRHDLREDGSDYTPTLEAAPAHAAWSRRYLVGSGDPTSNRTAKPKPETATAPLRWPSQSRTALYIIPSALDTTEDAIWISGKEPLTVFRSARDGKMSYVRAGNGLFGWVKTDVLD